MKTSTLLLLGAAGVLLAGCATPFRAPPDVAHLKLERADSPVVMVEKIWLERKKGLLAVKGYVVKQLEADDTTRTHLDVTLYGAAGAVLRSSVEHFEPRQIPQRPRRHNDSAYQVTLDPSPSGTTRLEVRAHEGSHLSAG